ncbi:2-hydroxyacid dehydrogenase [Chitinimonas sp.]|uniref:2-hydroxyacid dehydrogenase n=1 Tax=Chitinimonas sp. TaxID=1934313 RepID=UPI0035AE99AE
MIYILHPSAGAEWAQQLQQALPDRTIAAAPQPVDRRAVRYLVCWKPAAGELAGFSGLHAIFATGAGIDQLLSRDDLPADVPLIRLTDAGMAQQMLEYVLFGVLRYQRDMDHYAQQQDAALWQTRPPRLASATRIGILGLGVIGGAVAQGLARLGYPVSGWSRTARHFDGVDSLTGPQGLDALLGRSDILVNILPNTAETAGLLNAQRLRQLPKGAAIINAGRADQLDLAALVDLIDKGHLRGAQLDVFPAEPLASDSPLWHHPKLLLTPHIAAATLIPESARQIADKLAALEAGRPVAGLVNRSRAY